MGKSFETGLISSRTNWVRHEVMSDKPLFIRLTLPNGLEESIESLAREILRSQPKNVYRFAAEHFADQVRKRNSGQTSVKS